MRADDVFQKISDLLGSAGTDVETQVVQHFVGKEVKRRVDLLVMGLDRRKDAQNALKKIKPDVAAYDADGKVVSETYSKTKVEELKKAREAIDRLEKALERAFVEGQFDKLQEAINKPGPKSDGKEE